ncbi:uncharacterized protein F4822DRAFT_345036 [Hypoxylon trugodes]|uniref:uncharacterized protein n=1 Tax=Hypoxylon trugodes TaxID=326681 RepID=UPI00219A5106|nr:uncharacterized protein F4822DRAFT_345036 [Hypoxylon trugodes]KAI1385459.1 hypothetical protein F4822DRAFT_345036 [Hypoxylon trugodes]
MADTKATQPTILLISLLLELWFDEMYAPLLTTLGSKASVKRVKKGPSAIRLLTETPRPSAVLITDAAPSKEEHSDVWDAILQYVRQGGTAVIMGQFSSFVKPPSMEPFFSKAGLPWKNGPYYRTTFKINRGATGDNIAAHLPESYSQKALFVKDVALADSWYVTDDNSVIESHVFAPENAHTPGETPVAFASVGEGKLGYVGDVNSEVGSTRVVLAMCGLPGEI